MYSGYAVENESYKIELEQIFSEPSEKQSKLLVALAEKLEANDQGSEAIDVYGQLIASDSSLKRVIKAWFAIAEIYRKNSQYLESLKELDALNILLPTNKEVQKMKFNLLVEMATASSKLGNHKESINYFELASATAPENRLLILREYADQLMLDSQGHLAMSLYRETLESNPSENNKKLALIGLARAYILMQNYSEAIKTNQLVVEGDPQYNSYDFYVALAKDAAEHKQPDLSAEYYKKAIEADPKKRNELIREYAGQLTYSHYVDEAIVLYKELLNTDLPAKDMRLVRLDLAKAYVSTNQFPLALEEYEKILSDNPQDCQARSELVDLYINFARNDAKNFNHISAINWYLNAIALDPSKRVSLLREYADEVSKGGNGPEAISLYKQILISGSSSPAETRLTNLGLAQTYIWVNNHEKALEIYDLLLKINPRDREARRGKAQIYADYARFDSGQGNRVLAIEWYKKAIEVDPDERTKLIKELADQLRYNSQFDEAITLYKEILDSKPGGNYERETRLNLAQVYAKKFQYDDALKEYDYLLQQNK